MSVKGGTQCDSKQCSQSGCSPNRPLFGCLQVCMHAPSPDSIAVPVDASRDIEPLFRAVAYKKVDELIEDEGKDAGER